MFLEGKGDHPKILNFGFWQVCRLIQTFGLLVSFSYYLVLVLCIFDKQLKLLFFVLCCFFGKYIVTSLANSFSMQKSLLKKILDVNFFFVNRFSLFLRHILGQKEYKIMIR